MEEIKVTLFYTKETLCNVPKGRKTLFNQSVKLFFYLSPSLSPTWVPYLRIALESKPRIHFENWNLCPPPLVPPKLKPQWKNTLLEPTCHVYLLVQSPMKFSGSSGSSALCDTGLIHIPKVYARSTKLTYLTECLSSVMPSS